MASPDERWLEQAQYDLDTAEAMLETGRYLYVLFCCQQSIEKTLKAIIAKRTGQMPPRLHNLVRLAEAAHVELRPDQADTLRELSAYYIQSRYPDEMPLPPSDATRAAASEALTSTRKLFQWLASLT